MVSQVSNSRHFAVLEQNLNSVQAPVGAGEISRQQVWSDGGQSHGVWQMTPGRLREVQGPESVVILRGRAHVVIYPSQESVELQAGDVFVIDAGETADWTVTETVRKFYVVNR